MKLTGKNIAVLMSAIVCLSSLGVSCKKDSSDTKLYLDGELSFGDYKRYIEPGDSVVIEFSGVSHPKGKKLGLYCTMSCGLWSETDTICDLNVNPFTGKVTRVYTFPDTLELTGVTLRGVVLPEDDDVYYSSTSSIIISFVNRYLSIPQVAVLPEEPNVYIDPRDGGSYRVLEYNGTQWYGNNAYYGGMPDAQGNVTQPVGTSYYRCPSMDPVVGRYYNWDEASLACPVQDGWTLPSEEDWIALARYIDPEGTFKSGGDFANVAAPMLVDAYFNGSKLWEYWPAMKYLPADHTESVLGLLPMGLLDATVRDGYNGVFEYACLWTADKKDSDTGKQAFVRYVFMKENVLKCGLFDTKSTAMPVRCVRKSY